MVRDSEFAGFRVLIYVWLIHSAGVRFPKA